MKCIHYKKGSFKYQIQEIYIDDIGIIPPKHIDADHITLYINGRLQIIPHYAWDGASCPAIDTKNFMRGSLVHDALYQLIRKKHLDEKIYRKQADILLKKMCKEDGMCSIRACWVYRAVRIFGKCAVRPDGEREKLTAP